MQAEIELALRDLLRSEKNPQKVAEKVIQRLKSEKMGRAERKTFIAFLINQGLYKETYPLFTEWFLEKKRIPFRFFLSLLHRSGFKPGRDFLKYFEEAQNELEEKDQVVTFAPWAEYSNYLSQRQSNLVRSLEETLVRRRREAFDKLEFLKAQRLIAEEERLLKQMKKRDPFDAEVLRREVEFQERWARHLLNEKSIESKQNDLFVRKQNLSQEQLVWADEFTSLLEELVKKHPHQAYNFSIALQFIELYEHALILLRFSEENLSTLWFRLEMLLKSRRFIDCLDQIVYVEQKFSDDPETTFAATYLRAQVMRGLGQTSRAIELLKSIVAIRPQYRSAHALLLEWGAGASS